MCVFPKTLFQFSSLNKQLFFLDPITAFPIYLMNLIIMINTNCSGVSMPKYDIFLSNFVLNWAQISPPPTHIIQGPRPIFKRKYSPRSRINRKRTHILELGNQANTIFKVFAFLNVDSRSPKLCVKLCNYSKCGFNTQQGGIFKGIQD